MPQDQYSRTTTLNASPVSENTPSLQTSASAPQAHATSERRDITLHESKSDGYKPSKASGNRRRRRPQSQIFTFGIPDTEPQPVKTADTAPKTPTPTNGNRQTITATLKKQTQLNTGADNDLSTPLLREDSVTDAARTKRPPALYIPNTEKNAITVINTSNNLSARLTANAAAAANSARTVQKNTNSISDEFKLFDDLYDILIHALYTPGAVNFLSEQVTMGGKTLDKGIHTRITSVDITVADNMKQMIDVFADQRVPGQIDKIAKIIEIADKAKDQRLFCCFKPMGRTNASQGIYSTIGSIDINNLTAQSLQTLKNQLAKISPRLVETVAQTQQNRPV